MVYIKPNLDKLSTYVITFKYRFIEYELNLVMVSFSYNFWISILVLICSVNKSGVWSKEMHTKRSLCTCLRTFIEFKYSHTKQIVSGFYRKIFYCNCETLSVSDLNERQGCSIKAWSFICKIKTKFRNAVFGKVAYVQMYNN